MTEESIRYLKENIPILANAAVKQAYWQALATGSNVLFCENDLMARSVKLSWYPPIQLI
ncbi:hypothetical protein CRENPOLYSF2_4670001 [Crenothrix polyspora]|uniref:Uncharacterized protein n=1 Tax=Crenothrix polyspora TaxID=360316 RepID=A0A1R4HG19_9GAMM|nr:hypothetical protein [Crenothrix polyspora]SJM95165.1 hypothetical protein CRENPOLYSF2_4670001 [Crenothrix polyspora]